MYIPRNRVFVDTYILICMQLRSGWDPHKGIQEQRSQRDPIPKATANGSVFDAMGSWRLGHKRWVGENWLEESPILCLLQRLRHWGMPCPRAIELPLEPLQLVGRACLQGTKPYASQELPMGESQSHDLWLLHRQISLPSNPKGVCFGQSLKHDGLNIITYIYFKQLGVCYDRLFLYIAFYEIKDLIFHFGYSDLPLELY